MAFCKEQYEVEGFVGNDSVVVRTTKGGKKVANVTLYLNFYVKQEGSNERKKVTRIRDVAIYGEAAERAAKDLKKGMFVGVSGTPVAVSYENKKKEVVNAIKINTNSYQNYGFPTKEKVASSDESAE